MPVSTDEVQKPKRKRPERQLYVPPAQRSSPKNQPSPKVNTKRKTEENTEFISTLDFLKCRYLISSSCTCNINNNGILQFDVNTTKKSLNSMGDKWFNSIDNLTFKVLPSHFNSSPTRNKTFQYSNKRFYSTNFVRNILFLIDKLSLVNHIETYLDVLGSLIFFSDCDIHFIRNECLFLNRKENLYNHYFIAENISKNKLDCDVSLSIDAVKENKNVKKMEKCQNLIGPCKAFNGHEEEIEIMRKTKENINRKTRPIMKYVEEPKQTLDIKIDDIKDWEELLDDDGEFREDLLGKSEKCPKQKITNNVENIEIYDDEKQPEELEHMVELYDFPAAFNTNDLIQAFSDIESDAMYIQWVDETHAILVLGTLTQALRAINVANPLIKVRPMSVASKAALAMANKKDLKPAMRRPQTNLQTARRFISAHLGMKVGVSREVMTRERDDLKAAREMKKITKQNERDAWEGNLKSCIN